MCGRYALDESAGLREIVEAMNRSPLMARAEGAVVTSGEVFPSNIAPAIATDRGGKRAVFPMKWGFDTSNGRPLINARAESAADKPTFREAFAAHRCAIPASGYFEWERAPGSQRAGAKYRLQPEAQEITWLAGLYRIENGFPAFVVLTREAVDDIRFIHPRMPVILPDAMVDRWIDPAADPAEVLRSALTRLRYDKA